MLAALLVAAQVHVSGFEDLAGRDKVEHFAANLALTDAAWTAAAVFDAPLWVRIVAGASTGAVVSLGKEAWDYTGHGDPSLGDLAYDALGIGAGVGFALAFEAVWRRSMAADDDEQGHRDPPACARFRKALPSRLAHPRRHHADQRRL